MKPSGQGPPPVMFLAGVVLGAAICGLPYLVYAAEFPPWLMTTIALGVASAGLAVMRPSAKWLSGTGVGTGILVPMIATIVVDFQRDPTSHNLLPFEILIGLAVGMPPALLGALLGGLAGRIGVRGRSSELFAQPSDEGLGRWVYCTEADGRLRMARRRRINSCLSEGLPVPD